jgi:hypothetical protein
MVDPFLSTVRLFIDQSAPSAITTESPAIGVLGNETEKVPPEVSAITPSKFDAVYVEDVVTQLNAPPIP